MKPFCNSLMVFFGAALVVQAQLSLSLDRAESGPREVVRCTLRSGGPDTLTLPVRFRPEAHFIRFEITAPDGSRVPFTGSKLKADISQKDLVRLAPGMFVGQDVDLSGAAEKETWYTFSQPGVYRIRAIYEVPDYWKPSFGGVAIWTGRLESAVYLHSVPARKP